MCNTKYGEINKIISLVFLKINFLTQTPTMDAFSSKPVKQNFYALKAKHEEVKGGAEDIGYHKTCLEGICFVFTGDLERFGREEAKDLVLSMGGRVTGGPSKKTDFVVIGQEPGPKKLEKIEELSLPTMNEDDFVAFLKDRIANPTPFQSKSVIAESNKGKKKASVTPAKRKSIGISPTAKKIKSEPVDDFIVDDDDDIVLINDTANAAPAASPSDDDIMIIDEKPVIAHKPAPVDMQKPLPVINKSKTVVAHPQKVPAAQELILIDKYRPKAQKDLVGNSEVYKRLCNFLINFNPNSDDKSYKKAVMLHGAPGIGKTSFAHVAATECGFDILEFNASDTRSKKMMQNTLSESFQSSTITSYFNKTVSKKKVIIMDEVDGLGAGDRGGNQQLILFIKKTKVPVICICNDKSTPKMRSLMGYCEDLKYRKPTAQQIKAKLLKICKLERINIAENVFDLLSKSTNGDIRQILNILNTFALNPTAVLEYQDAKGSIKINEKDISMGYFDIQQQAFSRDFIRLKMTEQSDLFFKDYDLGPLGIQENYINCKLDATDEIEKLAEAADAISMGDLISTTMRRENKWNLLPCFGMISFVVPLNGLHVKAGHQCFFPSALGKMSTTNKSYRLLKQVSWHAHLHHHSTSTTFRLQYLHCLLRLIIFYFQTEDQDAVVQLLSNMSLVKEDMESLWALGVGDCSLNVFKSFSTKMKTAVTKMLNNLGIALPFDTNEVAKKKIKKAKVSKDDKADVGEMEEEIVEEEEEEEESEDKKLEKMKKKKRKAPAKKPNKGKK